ncbi:nucleotidyltransferase domain-containing protein [Virgibacillus kekensis]|uniref:Nucleotidyltransferase domain-containing protein n=1 Tax=Virgibacillus kekensis TaxID=202261 RepID=A0ABV9DNX3_9BACI
MKEEIQATLSLIEETKKVKILYACEAGSRAWDLASDTSDYDVRFIYIHQPEYYLSIDPVGIGKKRDVFEKPIGNSLDLSGWDLTKTLRLFRKSNPSLLEWLHSDIIYSQPNHAISDMEKMLPDVFNQKACILHYINVARTNLRKNHKDIKILINILRPVLAAEWIRQHNSFPPVNFKILIDTLVPEGELFQDISQLVAYKKTGNKAAPFDSTKISEFASERLEQLDTYAKTLQPLTTDPTDELNQLFRVTLHESWS